MDELTNGSGEMHCGNKTVEHYVDYRFRILYAVGIIMVVCEHASGGGISFIGDWFPYRGFHLALFAFCSGYFYKNSNEKDIAHFFFKKVKTLLFPMYLYTFIYGLVVQISRFKGFSIGGDFNWHNLLIAPITNGHQFVYNMGGMVCGSTVYGGDIQCCS